MAATGTHPRWLPTNPLFKPITNDPTKKGQLAARKHLFGPYKRYAIAPVHTRFDAIQWLVWDAETYNENGDPEIIRQAPTYEEAIRGLI